MQFDGLGIATEFFQTSRLWSLLYQRHCDVEPHLLEVAACLKALLEAEVHSIGFQASKDTVTIGPDGRCVTSKRSRSPKDFVLTLRAGEGLLHHWYRGLRCWEPPHPDKHKDQDEGVRYRVWQGACPLPLQFLERAIESHRLDRPYSIVMQMHGKSRLCFQWPGGRHTELGGPLPARIHIFQEFAFQRDFKLQRILESELRQEIYSLLKPPVLEDCARLIDLDLYSKLRTLKGFFDCFHEVGPGYDEEVLATLYNLPLIPSFWGPTRTCREVAELCEDWGQIYWAQNVCDVPMDLWESPLILDGSIAEVEALLSYLLGRQQACQLKPSDRQIKPPYPSDHRDLFYPVTSPC
ncbi:hypothetical protein IV102_05735 [bacterium]|nr:hypothetical protein [bacterium]